MEKEVKGLKGTLQTATDDVKRLLKENKAFLKKELDENRKKSEKASRISAKILYTKLRGTERHDDEDTHRRD